LRLSALPRVAAAFGQEAGGHARQLSLVHVTRLLVILVVAPIILVQVYGMRLAHPVGEPATDFLNRGPMTGEKREKVSTTVSTWIFRPVASWS
jgi:uncharacterized membrane protein AbrB (regulator of aidB expression)